MRVVYLAGEESGSKRYSHPVEGTAMSQEPPKPVLSGTLFLQCESRSRDGVKASPDQSVNGDDDHRHNRGCGQQNAKIARVMCLADDCVVVILLLGLFVFLKQLR